MKLFFATLVEMGYILIVGNLVFWQITLLIVLPVGLICTLIISRTNIPNGLFLIGLVPFVTLLWCLWFVGLRTSWHVVQSVIELYREAQSIVRYRKRTQSKK